MITYCLQLVEYLMSFFFSYERCFVLPPSNNSQADVIEAFTSIFRYLEDLLSIDYSHFKSDISH